MNRGAPKVNSRRLSSIEAHPAHRPTYQGTNRRHVVATFAISSVVSSLIFAWVVTRPALRDFWFSYPEYWVIPSKHFAILAAGVFALNLAAAYVISLVRGWLPFSTFRSIIGLAIIATLPLIVWAVEPFVLLLQFLLFRIVVALFLALSLWVITQRWWWRIAGLMLLVSLVTPVFVSLLFSRFELVSAEGFEVSHFVVGSVFLSLLFAYWLVKAAQSKEPRS